MHDQANSNEQLHMGHRQRLRERFAESGLDSFSDVQVLELLLFYSIARKDTNALAHRLLNRFGSLSGVMEASVEELTQVQGMGRGSAELLCLVTQVGRYYRMDKAKHTAILTSLDECGEYLVPYFYGRRNESVFLLCLDAKCKVLCCRFLGEGSVNSAGVPIRRIVETALTSNASSVVLAHNHPNGMAIPSGEDVQSTIRVAAALRAVDIILADHIVVADGDFVSMVQSGYRLNDYSQM